MLGRVCPSCSDSAISDRVAARYLVIEREKRGPMMTRRSCGQARSRALTSGVVMRKYFCAGLATLALACGSAGESSVSGDPGSGGQSGGSNLDVSHAGTGGGGPKCTRVETISALAIERPEPFDVDCRGSLKQLKLVTQ